MPEFTYEQAQLFLQYLTGFRELGISSEGETACAPMCPEVRAFLEGAIGLVVTPYAPSRGDENLRRLTSAIRALMDAFDTGRGLTVPMKEERPRPDYFLTEAEARNGLTRVRKAEGLIAQLPLHHDGRNTWLLNYGIGIEAQNLRLGREINFIKETQAAEPVK